MAVRAISKRHRRKIGSVKSRSAARMLKAG
jgi:hypothetical protein